MWHSMISTKFSVLPFPFDIFVNLYKSIKVFILLLLQSALKPPVWFWPAQLSLSLLSRKVFTECCCQQHVKPPNLENQWLEGSNYRHNAPPASEATRGNLSSGRWNYGWEMADNFAESGDLHVTFGLFLHAVILRHGTDGFTSPPKEGAMRIFCLKNPTASAGFEPANLGTKGQHATSRPQKPLNTRIEFITYLTNINLIKLFHVT